MAFTMGVSNHLHPILSGFPVAFLTLLVVVELLLVTRWRSTVHPARMIVAVSLFLGASASFLSGYQASALAGEFNEQANSLLSTHHTIGKLVLINSGLLALSLWISAIASHGKRVFQAFYYLLLVAQLALTYTAGKLGGEMVFEHGIGVSCAQNGCDTKDSPTSSATPQGSKDSPEPR